MKAIKAQGLTALTKSCVARIAFLNSTFTAMTLDRRILGRFAA
jgi:hypothetical protein